MLPIFRSITLVFLVSLSCVANSAGTRAVPGDLALTEVVDIGTSIVAARHAGDGSNRLFIVRQSGYILIYDLDKDTLLSTPFLDIDALVLSGGERGLLGLAFDPDFATNDYFFVNYTDNSGDTVIARYKVSTGDPDIADPGSASIVLNIAQPFSNHNGGDIQFGPDGYLYIGTGDGGSGGDPGDRSQNPMNLLGKMLRIDVSTARAVQGTEVCGGGVGYSIPGDNPFDGDDGTCDEIWALGLRNPWRFSFDRLTGDLFIGDVGQGTWEEIDFQASESSGGENYGWRCYEGDHAYNTSGCGPQGDYDGPILEYSHSLGYSVTGGYRYRGSIPGLYGNYVYADYGTGRVWFANNDGGPWTATEWGVTAPGVSSFGEDESGELYLLLLGGNVYRFESELGEVAFEDGFEEIPQ